MTDITLVTKGHFDNHDEVDFTTAEISIMNQPVTPGRRYVVTVTGISESVAYNIGTVNNTMTQFVPFTDTDDQPILIDAGDWQRVITIAPYGLLAIAPNDFTPSAEVFVAHVTPVND